jgi:hypothetical protein
MPDIEFHKVFNRISKKINLKGAGTPAEINARLNKKINQIRYEYGLNPLGQLQAESKISPLKTLMFAGFGRRTIDEAIANPTGKVALTLKYGPEHARYVLEKRARKRIY